MFSTKEQASTYMSVIEEQQDSLKQLVISVYSTRLYNLILKSTLTYYGFFFKNTVF